MVDKETSAASTAIADLVASRGMELVESSICYSQGAFMVRCLIDYPCGGISVGECASLNSQIAAYLETSKILGENFIVEVNSPGLDRKLQTLKDFTRVLKKEISLWLKEPCDGKTCLEGLLTEVGKDSITIEVKEKSYTIDISRIVTGKLRMTANDRKNK